MRRYRTIVRALFAVVFVAGGISHLVLGRVMPDDYAAFGDTAALGWLGSLWESFVMPNIGWLTIALGLYEIACGLGLVYRRTVVPAAWGMVAFLAFITVLGYGLPTTSVGEDLLKNRLTTIVMAGLLVPLLVPRRRPGNRGEAARPGDRAATAGV